MGQLWIKAEEWKKTQLVDWAQDESMTKPGVYVVDYEAVKTKGKEIGLTPEDIDDVVEEEWKKTQLVDWAEDEFMTKPGVYVVDYEAVKTKGKEIGLTPEDIDDVVDTLQKVLASRRPRALTDKQKSLSRPRKKALTFPHRSLTSPERSRVHAADELEFGQQIHIVKTQQVKGRDVDVGPEDTKTSTRTVQEGDKGYVYDGGVTADYYQDAMRAPGEIMLNDGLFLVQLDEFEPGTVVPYPAGEYHSRKVSSRKQAVQGEGFVMHQEGDPVVVTKTQTVNAWRAVENSDGLPDIGKKSSPYPTVSTTIENGTSGIIKDLFRSGLSVYFPKESLVVKITEFESGTVAEGSPGEYHAEKVSSTQGGVNMDATAQVPAPTPAEIEELNGITQQLAQEGDRKASEGADAIDIGMLQGLVADQVKVAASTGYTDVNATARAAFLMGQETKAFWKKALASLKKEYLPEMKIEVQKMTKWGTIKPSLGAVRDVVIKVLQSHEVYPFPELVQGIMENAFQERLLGPETHWPLSEPR